MRAEDSPGWQPAPRHWLALVPEPSAKQRAILLGMSPSERIALRLCILVEPGNTAARRTPWGLCLRSMDAIEAEELERLPSSMSAALVSSLIKQVQGRPSACGAP